MILMLTRDGRCLGGTVSYIAKCQNNDLYTKPKLKLNVANTYQIKGRYRIVSEYQFPV